MCEVENLIKSVEKHPCIWNINNTDYHNRDVKELAWEQICKEVFNDWKTCTDRAYKCAELKKKWTNIRDYYRKGVQITKKHPTGSAAKKSKTYVYSELLYFLKPIFAKKDSEWNLIREEEEYLDCTQPQLHSENEEQNTEQKTTAKSSNADEDDDTHFLLSFRSYMKRMNHHQKINFQLGMLQLIKKVTMENDPLSTSSQFH